MRFARWSMPTSAKGWTRVNSFLKILFEKSGPVLLANWYIFSIVDRKMEKIGRLCNPRSAWRNSLNMDQSPKTPHQFSLIECASSNASTSFVMAFFFFPCSPDASKWSTSFWSAAYRGNCFMVIKLSEVYCGLPSFAYKTEWKSFQSYFYKLSTSFGLYFVLNWQPCHKSHT